VPDQPDILYRDKYLLAVQKPPGWLVYGDRGSTDPGLKEYLQKKVKKPLHPVHRLDKDTGGVCIFALDSETASLLIRDFKRAGIKKRYLALATGTYPSKGSWATPLKNRKSKVSEKALTDFSRRDSFFSAVLKKDVSVLEVRPRTGRFHQIRRHIKGTDNHIVGDVIYGPLKTWKKDKRKGKFFFLLALSISFVHPRTKERISVQADDSEFLSELEKLRV